MPHIDIYIQFYGLAISYESSVAQWYSIKIKLQATYRYTTMYKLDPCYYMRTGKNWIKSSKTSLVILILKTSNKFATRLQFKKKKFNVIFLQTEHQRALYWELLDSKVSVRLAIVL